MISQQEELQLTTLLSKIIDSGDIDNLFNLIDNAVAELIDKYSEMEDESKFLDLQTALEMLEGGATSVVKHNIEYIDRVINDMGGDKMNESQLRNEIKSILKEELSNKNRNILNESQVDEFRAKFGTFTYWIEDEEPEAVYFTSRNEAIQYAKELINGFAMNYEDDDSLPESIEVWPKGRDGMWGNSGSPVFTYYFEGQPTLYESNKFK